MASLRGTDDNVVRRGRIPCALLEQPIEELPAQSRGAPVEPKSEFIEIRLELLFGCAALEGPEKPSLKQRCDTMDSRQFLASGSWNSSMPISLIWQPAIGPSAITGDQGSFDNALLHEGNDSWAIVIPELGEPNSANAVSADFCGNYYDILCLACRISRRQSANQGLIHFDITGELFPPWPHHSSTQFMQHDPSRFVTGQAKQSLQPHRTDAHFLIRHPPHGPIPEPQRNLAAVEDRSGREGYVGMAALAMESSLLGAPCFPRLALGTDEPLWPAEPREVITA